MTSTAIQVGSRVYLRNAVAGEPSVVVKLRGDRAHVHWPDLPEIDEPTSHKLDSLIVDEGFMARSHVDYESAAA